MKKTLTLHLDEKTMEQASQMAQRHQQPLSDWVADLIARSARCERHLPAARQRALERLRHGFRLGGRPLSREQIYAR